MNINKKHYSPISCSYYDRLEAWATLKTVCEVKFQRPDAESFQVVEARIVDIYSKNREEYIVLDTDEVIRLDRLASVSGIPNPSFANHTDSNANELDI